MRRDPLFYKLFQKSPKLLFDLLGARPDNATEYRFDSVAVKESKFEIDGVFLPPKADKPGVVYFCEVQFQKDDELYERLFSESALYFYRNSARFSDWQAVIIYPSRAAEQSKLHPHRSLLNGDQVHRVYLDELGEMRSLPIAVGAVVLTIAKGNEAPGSARDLLARTEKAGFSLEKKRDILDIVTSIMVYKLKNSSRAEVKEMLGIDLTEESRASRETKEEGRKVEVIALVTRLLTRSLGQALSDEMNRISRFFLYQNLKI